MIVVDASVAVHALTNLAEYGGHARDLVSADPAWVVPDHWTIEIVSALRGLERAGLITDGDATVALRQLPTISVEAVPTIDLLDEIWELRPNFTAYDAAYVAIAAQRDLTLVTADERLARAAVGQCRVELV